jgi:flavin reductase (DIM6/NTAB) family NADH-FMN oxidoreductase RutF
MSTVRPGTRLESRELRNAFGAYPTGVTVVTCVRGDGAAIGVTANSFVSLSLAPALVSVAFHMDARHLRVFLDEGAFAINVLCDTQGDLSNRFTRPFDCSWEGVPCRALPSGHLVLEGVAAFFLCRLRITHPVGDHLLLVGEVEQFAHDARAEPLAFWKGRYGTVSAGSTRALPSHQLDNSSATVIGWG